MSDTASSGERLLEGIRVLDLSRVMSGPFCTAMLADLGAEVIKIERPDSGDDARRFGPHVGGESAYFMLLNRNKKSMTLNLKSGTDQNAAIHLYTHERACPEARSARGRGVSDNARARQRPWISAVSARADSRAA